MQPTLYSKFCSEAHTCLCHVTAPFTAPHSATVKINNYVYPKGCMLLLNIYSCHMDPVFWGEDFKEFKPERWINEERNLIKLPAAFRVFGADNSHENPEEFYVYFLSNIRRTVSQARGVHIHSCFYYNILISLWKMKNNFPAMIGKLV